MVEYEDKKKIKYTLEDLETMLDSIPYDVFIKDADGAYVYVNNAFANKVFSTKEDLIGKHDSDVCDEKLSKHFKKVDKEVLKRGSGIWAEENVKTSTGEHKTFETYKAPLGKEGIKAKWILGFSKEITLDKTIVNELGKTPKRILSNHIDNNNGVLEGSKIGKIIKSLTQKFQADGSSIFLYNNEKSELKLYMKFGNTQLSENREFIHINQKIKKKIISNKNSIVIKELNKKNEMILKKNINSGYEQNAHIRTYSIIYENELIGLLNLYYENNHKLNYLQEDFIKSTCDKIGMIIKNILLGDSFNKELERRISSEKEMELFLQTATDICAVIDNKHHCKKIANKCIDMFGWSKEEFMQTNLLNFAYPDDKKNIIKNVISTKENGKSNNRFSNRFRCKNGEYKLIEWSLSYMDNSKDYLLTGRDVTEQKKLEEDKKKLEKAIEVENFKGEFFANISHEFKTPLNIILTTVQLILKNLGDKDSNNLRYIKGIKQNAYRLLRLVNNLIDITKIDGNYCYLELENYNIVSLIENVVLSVSEYIGGSNRRIIFDTCEEEIIVAVDPDKIERIILNLLSNSVKYTEDDGNIFVTLSIDDKNKKVIISVKDDGIGISKDNIESIFERFKQADSILTRRCEGSGLGLSIVRSLVEMHGGKVNANPNMTTGAEIIFDIPIKITKRKNKDNFHSRLLESKVEKCNIEFSDIYSV